jgi:hypothetical protein
MYAFFVNIKLFVPFILCVMRTGEESNEDDAFEVIRN